MSTYKYKIGDAVKIIKPTHKCFGNVGKILKINKNTLIVSGDEINCNNASVVINKNYVEFQERIPVALGINIDILLKSNGSNNQGLDYYMKKAFPLKDFDNFVLFHFIMPCKLEGRGVGIKKDKLTNINLLDKIIKEKKILGSERTPCVFFTAIPTKFFKKYCSEGLIDNYQIPRKNVFICLDSKILCNISNKYWIGANDMWLAGPAVLTRNNSIPKVFYALDSCNNKLEMTKSFLDFYIEVVLMKLENKTMNMLEQDTGMNIYLKDLDEDKFIHFLRKEMCAAIMGVELFICNTNWLELTKTRLNFKKEDVLIANYEISTVEENIKRVLKM